MPISEKIINEIERISISAAEKQLMMDLLTIEDEGVYQYVGPYEKRIKAYLEGECIREGEDD